MFSESYFQWLLFKNYTKQLGISYDVFSRWFCRESLQYWWDILFYCTIFFYFTMFRWVYSYLLFRQIAFMWALFEDILRRVLNVKITIALCILNFYFGLSKVRTQIVIELCYILNNRYNTYAYVKWPRKRNYAESYFAYHVVSLNWKFIVSSTVFLCIRNCFNTHNNFRKVWR